MIHWTGSSRVRVESGQHVGSLRPLGGDGKILGRVRIRTSVVPEWRMAVHHATDSATAYPLVHDTVVAGHPGRERTLAAARAIYFSPAMRVDTDAYVDSA